MQQEQRYPLDRNRMSVLIATVVLGSILFRFIELPGLSWNLHPFGSPLQLNVSGTWLLVVLTVALVCLGTNAVLHDHPLLEEHPGRPIYVAWILPGLTAGAAVSLLGVAPTVPLWIAGLVLMAVIVGLTIAAEYAAVSPQAAHYPTARLILNVLIYLLAFVLFALSYGLRYRSLITATLTMLVAALLALDLLSVADAPFRRVLLYAGLVGLVIAECTWVLNYWRISNWNGGLLLLLVFYVGTGIAHQYLLKRLTPRVLLEYAVVSVVALGTIFMLAL